MFGILRTLLAINVVLLHIFNVPTLGNYSVSFFFVLSGFLMTYIMHHTYGYSVKGFKVFWLNRFLRLYPIYWIILLGTMVCLFFLDNNTTHPHLYLPSNSSEWLYNVTMIYPDLVPHYIHPRLVPPSWALTNEIVFYFLISLGLSKTAKRTMLWLLLSILYYVLTYQFYDIPTYRYSAIFASSLPFSIGAILFWLNKNKPAIKLNFRWAVILYILFLVNAYYFRLVFKELSIYINLILAVFLIYTLFNIRKLGKIKKWDTYIGRFSYPIYLSHFLVLFFYSSFFSIGLSESTFKLDSNGVLPYFIFLFLVCLAFVQFIDVPIDKLKNNIKNRLFN